MVLFAVNNRSLQVKTFISKDFFTFAEEAKVTNDEAKEGDLWAS